MKKMLWLAFAMGVLTHGHAQTKPANGDLLAQTEIARLFPEVVKKQFGIGFPVFKVFTYNDKTGLNYVLLTESMDSIIHEEDGEYDTLHYALKAVCLRADGAQFVKNWEINDFIIKDNEESSVWFHSKVCSVTDLDGDGLVEPIIVYSTDGLNGSDDGRVKFIVVYKGKKVVIRHQDSTMDDGRNTRVDEAFYTLPLKVQQRMRAIMKKLEDNRETIYPTDWQKKMDQKKTYLD